MHFPIQQKLLNYFSKQNHVTNLVIYSKMTKKNVQEHFLLLLAFNDSFKSLKKILKNTIQNLPQRCKISINSLPFNVHAGVHAIAKNNRNMLTTFSSFPFIGMSEVMTNN